MKPTLQGVDEKAVNFAVAMQPQTVNIYSLFIYSLFIYFFMLFIYCLFVCFIGHFESIKQNVTWSGDHRLLVSSCITSRGKFESEVPGHRTRLSFYYMGKI